MVVNNGNMMVNGSYWLVMVMIRVSHACIHGEWCIMVDDATDGVDRNG